MCDSTDMPLSSKMRCAPDGCRPQFHANLSFGASCEVTEEKRLPAGIHKRENRGYDWWGPIQCEGSVCLLQLRHMSKRWISTRHVD